mgnify:CR=1 FL=1
MVSGIDVVFVVCPFAYTRNETFPYPRLSSWAERMGVFFPPVEIPNDENPFGVRGPYGKRGPRDAAIVDWMSTEFVMETKMTSFIKKMKVIVCDWTQIVGYFLHSAH